MTLEEGKIGRILLRMNTRDQEIMKKHLRDLRDALAVLREALKKVPCLEKINNATRMKCPEHEAKEALTKAEALLSNPQEALK